MEIYKTKVEYSEAVWIHIQSVNKREKKWVLQKLTINWKTLGYIDIYEANLILAQKINLLNKKNDNKSWFILLHRMRGKKGSLKRC